jgi:multiple sugar transport system substrate-binding protein
MRVRQREAPVPERPKKSEGADARPEGDCGYGRCGQSQPGPGLWTYLAWYAAPEHSAADVLDGSSGINPYRTSHLADPTPWRRLLSDRQAADYLGCCGLAWRPPGWRGTCAYPYPACIKALEEQLDMVLAGDRTPAAGLAAARAREALTDRRGRASQRRHDREAMGLATRSGTEAKP